MNELIQKTETKYDYSRLSAPVMEESQIEGFSKYIAEKIRESRMKKRNGAVKRITRSTLAEILGIDLSALTKIINGLQRTKKRDLIIALCVALELSYDETNQALKLYGMAPLNSNDRRDLLIGQALRDKLNVAELNNTLEKHGFPTLNIQRGMKEDEAPYYPLNSTDFEEESVIITPYCIAGDDADRDLNNRYKPSNFDYSAEMVIRKKNGTKYQITLEKDAGYVISRQEGDNRIPIFSDDPFEQHIQGIDECEDTNLLDAVTRLKEYVDRRAEYVVEMCNDTRNYNIRFNAVNNNGVLLLYGETFNYDSPELCEYFQLEASSNSCNFTVSNSSHFLNRYLGQDKWSQLYQKKLSPVTQPFHSLEEVTTSRWKKWFQILLDSAQNLLQQLRERKLFLYNSRAWYDFDQLMKTFHAEEAFDCYQPDDIPEMIPRKDHVIGSDGNPVTVDDLYRAAELGITTIDDLCAIRTRYGSLENFINIEALTEQKGYKSNE